MGSNLLFTLQLILAVMKSARTILLLLSAFASVACMETCSTRQEIYRSSCDEGAHFKRVSFPQLLDSINYYDKQYVEVTGRYLQGKEQSALVNDSLFNDHGNSHAFWVSFSQDCELYLAGTRNGLFEYHNGEYISLNKRLVTIRGKVDAHNKGHLKQYRGTIDRVSYLKM